MNKTKRKQIIKDFKGKKGSEARYTTINNSVINDERLKPKTLGILVYLLSKPEDWKPNVQHLAKHFNESESYIRKTIKELLITGYMVQFNTREKESGTFSGKYYMVYEKPKLKTGYRKKENAYKKISILEEKLDENPLKDKRKK